MKKVRIHRVVMLGMRTESVRKRERGLGSRLAALTRTAREQLKTPIPLMNAKNPTIQASVLELVALR
jgi:hypothetical protein